jgi:fructose-specific phosphotransferase system component IIB
VKGKVVLSIQDTSEINLYNHKNRLKFDGSLGTTNAPVNGLGFMVHPSIIIDAITCFPYGFAHVELFNRGLERQADKHSYKKLEIEQKESNKWLASSLATKKSLQEAATVIIVQDREGDIYEQFATIPDGRTHLLIRAKSDRTLPTGEKLFSRLASCEASGMYSIQIEGDKRKGQQKRTARLEVRFCEVEIKNSSRTAKNIASTVKLYCIEAKETGSKVKQSVCWRLLTTLPVTAFEEALMIIEWYSWRWMIEEVFRILKKEGFNIEASELGTGKSVRKLCLLMLDAIIKIFQMRICLDIGEGEPLPASMCFSEEEIQCIETQCKDLEGRTEKQRNPYTKGTLQYVTWVIARLGGWKGYASERKPGTTTLWIGLKHFNNTFKGWTLARDVYTR